VGHATTDRTASGPPAPLLALLAATHAHLLHHRLHLGELLHEPADLAGLAPRPLGDARPAAAVDELWAGPLLTGHRVDDRLDRLEGVVVDLGVLQLLGHARHHPQNALQRAHLLERLHLLEEVV